MALELNAASKPIVVALIPNCFDHSARPAEPATIDPASM
jgi:hypothetical protein